MNDTNRNFIWNKLCFAMFLMVTCLVNAEVITSLQMCTYQFKIHDRIKAHEYSEGIRIAEYVYPNLANDGMFPASKAQRAGVQMYLAMLYWSDGQKSASVEAIDTAISLLDDDCNKAAKIFRQKLKAGQLPKEFVIRDFTSLCGVYWTMRQASHDKEMRRLNRQINQLQCLNGMMDAEIQKEEVKQKWFAKYSKQNASMAYQKATKDVFNPDIKPDEDDPRRADWDACKKVYDIFK